MSSEGSISQWITEVKQGDDMAAQAIWDRCFPSLVRFARQRLGATPRTVEDEEDVALSALDSFFRAAQRGRLPDVEDRTDLWRFLSVITRRKCVDRIRRYGSRQKPENGQTAATAATGMETATGVEPVAADGPSITDVATVLTEECRELLAGLQDRELQVLALAKLEGYTQKEIAKRLHCSVRTVQRRLLVVRRQWERMCRP